MTCPLCNDVAPHEINIPDYLLSVESQNSLHSSATLEPLLRVSRSGVRFKSPEVAIRTSGASTPLRTGSAVRA